MYQNYIVKKRAKFDSISGPVNLPYGSRVKVIDGFLCDLRGDKICSVTSQNAYDYFAQDDDHMGVIRGGLIDDIFKIIKASPSDEDKKLNERLKKWEIIWKDPVCLKYKRPEYEDFWVWNFEFFNAPISDLKYILNIIGG